jgi:hypothetical protein
MTSQGNGEPLQYQVTMSEQTKAALKQLHAREAKSGTGQRFLAALRKIFDKLRTTPTTFGEALYRLPALKLEVYQAIVAPLVVDYAVHEDQPLVFIRGFKTLS